MMAPMGIVRSSVNGGGDWRTLEGTMVVVTMALRSSEVPWGVKVPVDTSLAAEADGVRLCLWRYDDDRGRFGRAEDCSDERRLALGEAEADDAGDRLEGGV